MASWTVPPNPHLALADSPDITHFLYGDIPDTAPDLPMRLAEFFDVMRSLTYNVGRTFHSRDDAVASLFTDLSGGGFGIPTVLIDIVLRLLDGSMGP